MKKNRKNTFIILLFLICILNVHSQSCGVLNIKIVGKINSRFQKFEKVKIPEIRTLEYKSESKFDKNKDFMEFKIENNQINIKLKTLLGSLYENAESLKNTYKEKNTYFFIILMQNNDNFLMEKKVKIDWNKIVITKINSKTLKNNFEINLGNLNLDNE